MRSIPWNGCIDWKLLTICQQNSNLSVFFSIHHHTLFLSTSFYKTQLRFKQLPFHFGSLHILSPFFDIFALVDEVKVLSCPDNYWHCGLVHSLTHPESSYRDSGPRKPVTRLRLRYQRQETELRTRADITININKHRHQASQPDSSDASFVRLVILVRLKVENIASIALFKYASEVLVSDS